MGRPRPGTWDRPAAPTTTAKPTPAGSSPNPTLDTSAGAPPPDTSTTDPPPRSDPSSNHPPQHPHRIPTPTPGRHPPAATILEPPTPTPTRHRSDSCAPPRDGPQPGQQKPVTTPTRKPIRQTSQRITGCTFRRASWAAPVRGRRRVNGLGHLSHRASSGASSGRRVVNVRDLTPEPGAAVTLTFPCVLPRSSRSVPAVWLKEEATMLAKRVTAGYAVGPGQGVLH